MEFGFTDDQLELMEGARKFGERAIAPSVLERDAAHRFDLDLWKAMGDAGLLGAPIPTEYGGTGLSCIETCLVSEGFGEGSRDAGLALAWGASTILCAVPIWKLGTEDQRKKYLPSLCSGDKLGAFCLSEAGSGSDAASMKTRAEKKGDKYILNGSKMWITNGPLADTFVVTAVTSPGQKAMGISTFIVEKDFPGFKVGQIIDKMGMRTSTTAEILFEDCEVPEENLLGQENFGFIVTAKLILGWERSCLLAPALGAMRGGIAQTAQYAKEREQFNRPIAKFQAVRHMIADLKVRYEVARQLIYRVAWQLDQGDDPPLVDAAVAKVFVSEVSQVNARDCIQLHGGNGYTPEYHVERGLRDAMLGTIGAGTSEVQRSIIARSILDLGF
jgi:alkylation response protein AidB-like acyl-CoA dehydrogenase